MISGLKSIFVASICPVLPVTTSIYVGFFLSPPEYPDSTLTTPVVFSKASSTHQKQPPAK